LDSRQKIIDPEQAQALAEANSELRVVTGYFDPLLAAHAEALARTGCGLLVLVVSPADPLLPVRARAELVAALRCVDWVVPLNDDVLPEWVVAVPPGRLIRREREDQERRDAFLRRVYERNGSA
jgi:bifunctional ADP-heptose synthase (sugar kinase/adenylyltransferase)